MWDKVVTFMKNHKNLLIKVGAVIVGGAVGTFIVGKIAPDQMVDQVVGKVDMAVDEESTVFPE